MRTRLCKVDAYSLRLVGTRIGGLRFATFMQLPGCGIGTRCVDAFVRGDCAPYA